MLISIVDLCSKRLEDICSREEKLSFVKGELLKSNEFLKHSEFFWLEAGKILFESDFLISDWKMKQSVQNNWIWQRLSFSILLQISLHCFHVLVKISQWPMISTELIEKSAFWGNHDLNPIIFFCFSNNWNLFIEYSHREVFWTSVISRIKLWREASWFLALFCLKKLEKNL